MLHEKSDSSSLPERSQADLASFPSSRQPVLGVLLLRIRERNVRDAEELLLRDVAVGVLVNLPDGLQSAADGYEHATGRGELWE